MTPVTWHGVTAEYGATERAFMRTLARRARLEAWRLHVLKAMLDAEIVEGEKDPISSNYNPPDVWVYTWGNSERRRELKGRRCVIEAKGRKRTVLVRFLDTGERVTTDQYAIRRVAA